MCKYEFNKENNFDHKINNSNRFMVRINIMAATLIQVSKISKEMLSSKEFVELLIIASFLIKIKHTDYTLLI